MVALKGHGKNKYIYGNEYSRGSSGKNCEYYREYLQFAVQKPWILTVFIIVNLQCPFWATIANFNLRGGHPSPLISQQKKYIYILGLNFWYTLHWILISPSKESIGNNVTSPYLLINWVSSFNLAAFWFHLSLLRKYKEFVHNHNFANVNFIDSVLTCTAPSTYRFLTMDISKCKWNGID